MGTMTPMDRSQVVNLRAGRIAIVVAWLILVSAALLLVASFVLDGLRGLGTAVIGFPFVAIATAVIRTRVRATSEGVLVVAASARSCCPGTKSKAFVSRTPPGRGASTSLSATSELSHYPSPTAERS